MHPELKNRAKSESGFKEVSRSIFIDFGGIPGFILEPKSVKNQTKKRSIFHYDFGCDLGRFWIQSGIGSGSPGRNARGCWKLKFSDRV